MVLKFDDKIFFFNAEVKFIIDKQKIPKSEVISYYLDFDVDFLLLENGQVSLAKLNEFSKSLEITEDEFKLALLLDGKTPAYELVLAVYGYNNMKLGIKILDQLIPKLVNANLCVLLSSIPEFGALRLGRKDHNTLYVDH